jgi:hypothetical protein
MISVGLITKGDEKCLKNENESNLSEIPLNFKWNEEVSSIFKEILKSNEINDKISEIMTDAADSESPDVEKMVQGVNNLLISAANKSTCSNRKSVRKTKRRNKSYTKKKWFDQSCVDLKKRLRAAGNCLLNNPKNPIIRGKYFVLKKIYKTTVKKKKREFKKELISRLERMSESNPKEYWKLVDELRKDGGLDSSSTVNYVSPSDWVGHYKSLLSPTKHPVPPELLEDVNKMKSEPFFSDLDYRITKDEVKQGC